ncbi:hypothetical protein KP79_PYT14669 [Mizuhopecten yessoensis]|uniref:Transmembrane protein 53 n=2 Tax=Mizuhopecten yessoensis TaxID=6573 RepID=A0A210R316_MIZYE|nr:hypothetical protein KP79_PYT14669 [Mizuhopecten yessoensis]
MKTPCVTITNVKQDGLDLQLRRIIRPSPLPQSHASGNVSGTLVLFFGWLGAKSRYLESYFDLYHQENFDILYIPDNVKLFVWPPLVDEFAKSLMTVITNNDDIRRYDNFLVHGVSIGAYVFTCCLMKADKHQAQFSPFVDKIQGVVLDSPTYGSFERMRKGVAEGLAKNRIVKAVIPRLLSVYFYLTWKYTVEFFEKAMHFLEERPLNVPYAMFFSREDPMCDADVIMEMIENWREKSSVSVITRFWKKSVHAAHLRYHPDDYRETFHHFISVYLNRLQEQIKNSATTKSKL